MLEATQPLECGAGTAVTPRGRAARGSTKAPGSLIPSSEKGGDVVTGRRQSWRLNSAFWDGAKHGPPWQIRSPNIAGLWVLPVPHTSGHRNHKAGEHVAVGCSALGRGADLSRHAASCPLDWFPPH